MTRQKRSRNGRTESVYELLRDQVVHGSFRPGEQLYIEQLAERLNSSATPVREALVRLHAESLVTAVPSRGYFAKILSGAEVAANIQFLVLILEHAILRSTPADGEAWPGTEAGVPAEDALEDPSGYACTLAAEALFERIAALSGNVVMTDTMRSLSLQIRQVRLIYFEDGAARRRAQAELGALADALGAGRPQAAVRALHAHMADLSRRLETLVKEANARALMRTGAPSEPTRPAPPDGRQPAPVRQLRSA